MTETTETYDLHCHSTASDGSLTPTELVARAKEMGVTTLALTDHDTLAGQQEAKHAALSNAMTFINGIEVSTVWENKSFHIVGLNINLEHSELNSGIKKLQALREQRVKKIALKLEQQSIAGSYDAVIKATKGGVVTRTHFADYLLAQNQVSTKQEAFSRYLGQGKPAFVATIWADLCDAIAWINHAGGVAVVAHPLQYKMTESWMRRFLLAFKELGGSGIEVVTGRSHNAEINRTLHYAEKYGLAASVGSDFHTPNDSSIELGRLLPLPKNITPIWELF